MGAAELKTHIFCITTTTAEAAAATLTRFSCFSLLTPRREKILSTTLLLLPASRLTPFM